MDWASHMRRILARLGEDATFTHGTSQPSSVRGVFAAPGVVLPGGFDAGFDASEPRFGAPTADLPSVAIDDTLAIGAVLDGTTQIRAATTYKIVDIKPDDPCGLTYLQLQKTS